MAVAGWCITEDQWRQWLHDLLAEGTRLVAPVNLGEDLRLFRSVAASTEVSVTENGSTRWSPKEFLFPRTEKLFHYNLSGDEVGLEGPDRDDAEQMLFGLRPCDAAGISRLDDVYLDEKEDSLYADRRSRTTVVSIACASAMPECFCTAVGGSPTNPDGSDLQLATLGPDGTWLLTPLTERGEALVSGHSAGWTPAAPEDHAVVEETRLTVEESIERARLSVDEAEGLAQAFEHPLWQTLGERCLGCGICAYVCPTCSCFDIGDDGTALCGDRCRFWDSCTFAQFTVHSSGHNPRPDQPARYRQRVLHKFTYFPELHDDRFMCVGCGRCVKLCPVGIDIHDSVAQAVATRQGAEPLS